MIDFAPSMAELRALAVAAAWLTGAVLVGLVVHKLVFMIGRRAAAARAAPHAPLVIDALRAPSRLLLPVLVVQFALPLAGLSPDTFANARHGAAILAIAAVTWLLSALVGGVASRVIARLDVSAADNLHARRMHTQITVLERTVVVVIVIIGVASVLMTFPRVREIGASLLVSAGFVGLAVGLAARPVLENLIGGLQLAFTQPIRIDDVVIVEGEWGWIEEITATYVVVRIWDQRRLIVPLSRFITQPFQNWTRTSSEILGTVTLHADYTLPVQALREELERICRASDLWDERVCNLQVTEAGEHTMELRALVSARSSGQAWDLRVHVREKLIEFMQRAYPQCLPRTRVLLDTAAAGSERDLVTAPGQDRPDA